MEVAAILRHPYRLDRQLLIDESQKRNRDILIPLVHPYLPLPLLPLQTPHLVLPSSSPTIP
jgi:hypothetical protein